LYLLCLVDILWHCQKNAVDQNGEHYNIVEVLIGGHVDHEAAKLVPWCKDEQGSGCRKPLDVVLIEASGDNAKSLKKIFEKNIKLLPCNPNVQKTPKAAQLI
jgi:hypothetical protein